MKKLNILVLFLIFFASLKITFSQVNQNSIQAGWGALNYAVPESPAFKILDVGSSNIMRPTSTRDIALSIGNHYVQNGASIPGNLAIEIAPSLFKPKVSLAQYARKRIWYTGTFSVGTTINSDGSYGISGGIKVKLIDKADLRTNSSMREFVRRIGPLLNNEFTEALDEIAREDTLDRVGVSLAYSDSTNADHARIKQAVDERLNEKIDLRQIPEFRERIKNQLWNAQIWDLGIAALFTSSDSLVENLNGPTKAGLWTTYGHPLGKKGQLLLGANTQLSDDENGDMSVFNFNIGARLYYGRNNFKGFIEYENYTMDSEDNTNKAGLGLEVLVFGGLWLNFNLAWLKQGDDKATFTPGFSVFFANAEKR